MLLFINIFASNGEQFGVFFLRQLLVFAKICPQHRLLRKTPTVSPKIVDDCDHIIDTRNSTEKNDKSEFFVNDKNCSSYICTYIYAYICITERSAVSFFVHLQTIPKANHSMQLNGNMYTGKNLVYLLGLVMELCHLAIFLVCLFVSLLK
jgi:disulfide bond formation protein DsbB